MDMHAPIKRLQALLRRLRGLIIHRRADSSPVSDRRPSRSNEGADPASPASVRILIVEDDSICRQMLKAHLSALCRHVEAVDSGERALARLRTKRFHMIFLDLHMPRLNGIQTTRRIRRLDAYYRRVPIIGLTADSQRKTMKAAIASGMDAFLTKPVTQTDLAPLLMQHWGKDEDRDEDNRQPDAATG